jgi:hypothetical protein
MYYWSKVKVMVTDQSFPGNGKALREVQLGGRQRSIDERAQRECASTAWLDLGSRPYTGPPGIHGSISALGTSSICIGPHWLFAFDEIDSGQDLAEHRTVYAITSLASPVARDNSIRSISSVEEGDQTCRFYGISSIHSAQGV